MGVAKKKKSRRRMKRKFPICVNAQVIDPFGVAAQKAKNSVDFV